MSKLDPEKLRLIRQSYRRQRWQRAGVMADHRPADPVVLRLFTDLHAAWDVQKRFPAKAAKARTLERMAWENLVEYLATFECDPAV
jgi:hypothetical protein